MIGIWFARIMDWTSRSIYDLRPADLHCCYTTTRQIQTSMPGSPVAVRPVRAVACLSGRWLSPHLGQHMSLSEVSRCPELRRNHEPSSYATEPLQLLDLGCGIQTSATDGSDDSWRVISSGTMNTALWPSICSAIEKRFTYLLTYLLTTITTCNSLAAASLQVQLRVEQNVQNYKPRSSFHVSLTTRAAAFSYSGVCQW